MPAVDRWREPPGSGHLHHHAEVRPELHRQDLAPAVIDVVKSLHEKLVQLATVVVQVVVGCVVFHPGPDVPEPHVLEFVVRLFEVFEGVEAAGPKPREQVLETLEHVMVHMTAIVNDDIEVTSLPDHLLEHALVRLAADRNRDAPPFVLLGARIDIQAEYPPLAKICLPGAKGVPVEHADLQQIDRPVSQRMKIPFIYGQVAHRPTLRKGVDLVRAAAFADVVQTCEQREEGELQRRETPLRHGLQPCLRVDISHFRQHHHHLMFPDRDIAFAQLKGTGEQ